MKRRLSLYTLSFFATIGWAQAPFTSEIKPSYNNNTPKLDCKIFAGEYTSSIDFVDVLAISSDCTVYDAVTNKFAPMKGNIGAILSRKDPKLTGAKQDSTAMLFATIDKIQASTTLGDGGGVVMFKAKRQKQGHWKLDTLGRVGTKGIYFKNVDYRAVGGTVNNQDFCPLALASTKENTPARFLVTENVSSIRSNKDLAGFTDTSNFVYPASVTQATQDFSVIPAGKTVKRFQTMGWATQVGANGAVIAKMHRLGRGVTAVANNATILVYGGDHSVIATYESPSGIDQLDIVDYPLMEKKTDGLGNEVFYDKNPNLKALKLKEDGTIEWVPFAFEILDSVLNTETNQKEPLFKPSFDSLLIAKEVAIRAGATVFNNIGDIAVVQDESGEQFLVVTEKGQAAPVDLSKYKNQLAVHLKALDATDGTQDGKLNDPFGRILSISLNPTYKSSVLLQGGAAKTVGGSDYFFSNPDKLELATVVDNNSFGYNYMLTVKENIPATTMGRNPNGTQFVNRVNEAYFVEYTGLFSPYGLPFDWAENSLKAIPFEDFKLYMSGSNGAMLSSGGGSLSPTEGTFFANASATSGYEFDTYFTVVNGFTGTDKSYVLAVRNIYPNPVAECVKSVITSFGEKNQNSSSFDVWPNPAKDVLNVNEVADYAICDVAGQALRSYANTNKMDISGMASGLYILKQKNGQFTKVVLE
jgi:hypothetical protein